METDKLHIKTKYIIVKSNNKNLPLFINNNDENENKLFIAINDNDLTKMKEIIKNGTNVNIKIKNNYQYTPLHFAATNSILPIVNELIKAGADINEPSYNGRTALHYAVLQNNYDIVVELINAKCDINKKDLLDCTALDYAIEKDYLKIQFELIKKGAHIKSNYTTDFLSSITSLIMLKNDTSTKRRRI